MKNPFNLPDENLEALVDSINGAQNDLRILSMKGTEELGELIRNQIAGIFKLSPEKANEMVVEGGVVRFNDGDGKFKLESSVRDKVLFILLDPYNHGVTYKFYGENRKMSPDEHIADLKRAVSAISGRVNKQYIVMPMLYQGRQDRRTSPKESLDCAVMLKDLELGAHNLREIITLDIHNQSVENAVNKIGLSNIYPTHLLLSEILDDFPELLKNPLVIAPDAGALQKAIMVGDLLGGTPFGNFNKRRDFTKIEGGKHPVASHEYAGTKKIDGTTVIIPDDIIASGGTMLNVAESCKNAGAEKVILMASHGMFSGGPNKFDEAYAKGIFDKVYTPNLTYTPQEVVNNEWYKRVDCSSLITETMLHIIAKQSVSALRESRSKTLIDKVQTIQKEFLEN